MNRRRQYFALTNRELRRVALTWLHPRDESGDFIPLSDRAALTDEIYADSAREGRSRQEVEARSMPDFSAVPDEQMGLQAYDTTTEGTPISPVFPDTPEGRFDLVQYCAQHETVFASTQASLTEWTHILFNNDAAIVNLDTGTVAFPEPEHASN